MRTDRRTFVGGAAASICLPARLSAEGAKTETWSKLPTEHYRGKQDDVFFINSQVGWYGNGAGRIFKTSDGGRTWTKTYEKPGTYVRAIGFIDAKVGFFGNIGTGYFPGVSDEQPLYRTDDGGSTWVPVTAIAGPQIGRAHV